ncbi:hypothetical protein BDR07DRAFT_1497656 [Suillus spraguei]|nr:hypothetical protein BDR07DRAFT_1497656 [Suillus spraguei]
MGAGKRTRIVSVEEHQTTQAEHIPHPVEQSVLICEEAAYEDQPISHVETLLGKDSINVPTADELYKIINLYSTGDVKNDRHYTQHCSPFQHHTSFIGPQGEVVRVQALFDEGNWSLSMKHLRMVNGTIIPSEAVWKGDIVIGGIWAAGEFKVFQSGGGWEFLFRKQLLQTFKAVHDYKVDDVSVTGIGGMTILCNRIPAKETKVVISKEAAGVQRIIEEVEMENLQRRVNNFKLSTILTQAPTGNSAHRDEDADDIIPICINMDGDPITPAELDTLLKEIPTDFLRNDAAIYTWLMDPHNPLRIVWITKRVQYGEDLTPEELKKVKALVFEYADIFACSLGEVIPVPGAIHKLNIPDGTTFNLGVHQRPLTPLQLQFLHGKVDEMLKAGIIEHAPLELVKCCANTVLAKKAHKQEGMMLEELQRAINS